LLKADASCIIATSTGAVESRTMPDQHSPPATAVASPLPVKQGSIIKGIFTSLVFQGIAFFVGIVVFVDYREGARPFDASVDRRQAIGWFLMSIWGLTHWAMAYPMARRWKRLCEGRSVKGMYGVSILAAIPSSLALAYCLFLAGLFTFDKIKSLVAK